MGAQAGYTRDVGAIEGTLLTVIRKNGSIVKYRLSPKGDRLEADYFRLGRTSKAVMVRPEQLKVH